MNLTRLIILFLFASVVPLNAQNIYSWVDENGVRHFSDTSPGNETRSQSPVTVKQPIYKSFDTHRLYLVKEGYGYCGSKRLSVSQSEDPRQLLIAFLLAQKNTTVIKQNLKQELHQLRNTTTSAMRASKTTTRIEEEIEECECLLAWMGHELEKLEKVKDQIIMEARQAEFRHAEAQNLCGPEPVTGVIIDPATISWLKCDRDNMQLRNKLLKEKKERQNIEEELIRSMK